MRLNSKWFQATETELEESREYFTQLLDERRAPRMQHAAPASPPSSSARAIKTITSSTAPSAGWTSFGFSQKTAVIQPAEGVAVSARRSKSPLD
jgi:hypothetical protein